MNPRRFIQFFRSPTGVVVAFLLIMAVVMIVAIASRNRETAPPTAVSATGKSQKPSQTVESVERNMVPMHPPTDPVSKKPGAQAAVSTPPAPVLPPISLVAETPSREPEPKRLSEDFAPYGRLIPCELIVTVDSSSIQTPVIGLITEDIYHHGRLVIPAGTEVHGRAQVDRTRERISSEGLWTLVWQTGEEMKLSGLALDRESDGQNWGVTDGSAGLRGRLIKTDDLAEIKMFAATLLSGAADAFTDKRDTPFGSYALPSLQNAPLKGGQKVLDRYADQIMRTIERDGFYVRVPAGKQFYLYVTQTINKADAMLGGTALPLLTKASAEVPAVTPPATPKASPPLPQFRPAVRSTNTIQ